MLGVFDDWDEMRFLAESRIFLRGAMCLLENCEPLLGQENLFCLFLMKYKGNHWMLQVILMNCDTNWHKAEFLVEEQAFL